MPNTNGNAYQSTTRRRQRHHAGSYQKTPRGLNLAQRLLAKPPTFIRHADGCGLKARRFAAGSAHAAKARTVQPSHGVSPRINLQCTHCSHLLRQRQRSQDPGRQLWRRRAAGQDEPYTSCCPAIKRLAGASSANPENPPTFFDAKFRAREPKQHSIFQST